MKININMGTIDRVIRIAAGIIIILIGVIYQSWWGAVGIFVILSAAIGFCPLYAPFGLKTCKIEFDTEKDK